MKLKTLATALTVTMPLVFGTAYAQTSTTADTGNNRAAERAAMNTNQSSATSGGTNASSTSGNTAATGSAESRSANTGGSNTGANSGTAASNSSTTGANSSTSAAGGTGASSSTGSTGATGATNASGTTGAAAAGTGAASSAAAPGTTANDARTNTPDAATASTEAITGWSAKDDFIGKSVFNENDEKVGDIKDVVISSDGRTLYLLVGAGGFLGMGEKDVAVPFDRFERSDDRVLLSGYTKEQLKALPEVEMQR